MSVPFRNVIRKCWKGFNETRHLVIFGDSYSDVGFDACGYDIDEVTEDNPLGVEWPGNPFCETNQPNWVGYIARDRKESDNPLLVFDYAVGGHTVQGVINQVNDYFTPNQESIQWYPNDTLFVTWVGINDVGSFVDPERAIRELISLQKDLYALGGRNFLFIDVPPIDRSPAGLDLDMTPDRYEEWNSTLSTALLKFSEKHDEATVLLFSAWDTFTKILDDPAHYGMDEEDEHVTGRRIWFDDLHPSTWVHKVLSGEIMSFLRSQSPLVNESGGEREGVDASGS
ncbi:hypothetical protein SISNIDRAFT_474841 [Sistotremastrum niveocremeum HHB9708]|uniref:Carbohydrate esterase family 16 protein n=1 Tax=Sistotremastrum niveocremeum HHB9708 TaxID=1314777 RepID=A0A164T608_9AGAM|nr:hypothetical protein SISNIDRAFT_474841 [Sistotremastrum niveocremeum HHB9708]